MLKANLLKLVSQSCTEVCYKCRNDRRHCLRKKNVETKFKQEESQVDVSLGSARSLEYASSVPTTMLGKVGTERRCTWWMDVANKVAGMSLQVQSYGTLKKKASPFKEQLSTFRNVCQADCPLFYSTQIRQSCSRAALHICNDSSWPFCYGPSREHTSAKNLRISDRRATYGRARWRMTPVLWHIHPGG